MKHQALDSSVQESKKNNHLFDYVALAILIFGIVLFYYLKINIWFKWSIVLLSLVLSISTFFFISSSGLQLHTYIRDSWNELAKVVWPTRKETVMFTWVIFIIVLILAIILWIFDSTLSWLFYHVFL